MPRSCAARLAVRTRTAARPTGRREPRERNAAVKPVSRILFAVASPLRALLWRNDHSSSSGITAGIKQPTRRLRTGRPQPPPYLVLLRAGFCLPPTLPPARCALTAPFHHCLPAPKDRRQLCIFCATVRQVTLPGRYPAHCPVEFGLSSPGATSHDAVTRDSRLTPAAIVWPGCGSSLPRPSSLVLRQFRTRG